MDASLLPMWAFIWRRMEGVTVVKDDILCLLRVLQRRFVLAHPIISCQLCVLKTSYQLDGWQ